MKYYEFIDKAPAVGRLVVIEGTARLLAEQALATLLDRVLPPDLRALNLSQFGPADLDDTAPIREAMQAMPFLADRRVVVINDAQTLRAQPRRDLFDLLQSVPEGSTVIVMDLLAPRSAKPQGLGALLGRAALRIDTSMSDEVRQRFIGETLSALGASAEPRVIDALVRSEADLGAVRNDLQKLALAGKKITLRDLESESLVGDEPKAYKFASFVVEGKTARALAVAGELFATDPRGAAMPLLSALATECGLIWELARPGGALPARVAWRERMLRPLAAQIGARRARAAHDRAMRGCEAIVTGQSGNDPEDQRTLVERIAIELSALRAPR